MESNQGFGKIIFIFILLAKTRLSNILSSLTELFSRCYVPTTQRPTSGINFHPAQGQILICHYGTMALGAEMIKARPCVVISPRLRRREGLCTVVPLSTTPPKPPEAWHHLVRLERPLPAPFDSLEMWAKCDMVSTVSYKRLSPIRCGKDQYGKRKYLQINLLDADLLAIQHAVKAALGLFN